MNVVKSDTELPKIFSKLKMHLSRPLGMRGRFWVCYCTVWISGQKLKCLPNRPKFGRQISRIWRTSRIRRTQFLVFLIGIFENSINFDLFQRQFLKFSSFGPEFLSFSIIFGQGFRTLLFGKFCESFGRSKPLFIFERFLTVKIREKSKDRESWKVDNFWQTHVHTHSFSAEQA